MKIQYLMRQFSIFLMSVLAMISCKNNNNFGNQDQDMTPQVKVYAQFDELAPKFYNTSDTTYIVNFWATSCPPCIKEMPHFNEFHKQNQGKKTKILLVSLDRQRDLEKRVIPFVGRHGLLPEVSLLEDQNYSAWTEKIDTTWYGALPATLIVRESSKVFSFGAFETFKDLEDKVALVN
jgi:thiol-disulfide isomerase/thioredoxin